MHQVYSKNEWLLLSVTFTANLELVLLKNGPRDFQNSPRFERSACFYVTISESFKRFQYFKFEQIFWKTKTFFKKLEYHKTHHFHSKLLCQKPLLRQVER